MLQLQLLNNMVLWNKISCYELVSPKEKVSEYILVRS